MRKRKKSNAGLLITVIFHFTVVLLLFWHQIDISKQLETSFVIDFSKEEERERLEREAAELQEQLEKEMNIRKALEEKYAANIPSTSTEVKNIAVNNGKPLKDDRGTDAEQLYKDAARLQEELKKGHKSDIYDEAGDETVDIRGESASKEEQQSYSGPSVLSYTLDGRTARSLPNPAYKCYGGGEVTVIIWVDRNGNVVDAQVNESISASDACIRKNALDAAKRSKFSRSSTAPEKQVGEIVYLFIAQ